jgi:hypothetical protein
MKAVDGRRGPARAAGRRGLVEGIGWWGRREAEPAGLKERVCRAIFSCYAGPGVRRDSAGLEA